MSKERLYYYYCKEGEEERIGYTWDTSRKEVIQDVKSNYYNAKRIVVKWVREDSHEFLLALELYPYLRGE